MKACVVLIDYDTSQELQQVEALAYPYLPRVGERVSFIDGENPPATAAAGADGRLYFVVLAVEHDWDLWRSDNEMLCVTRLRVRKSAPFHEPTP